MSYGDWEPYVPVAARRARAAKEVDKLRKKGTKVEPIEVQGRKIVRTFWGEAWCRQLENFSDYQNRLPRGRTYVRNGSVCHLAISSGKVEAIVSGSQLYRVNVSISPLPEKMGKRLQKMHRPDWLRTGIIAGTFLQPCHGDSDRSESGAIPQAQRDNACLQLSRPGKDVQTRCRRSVRCWRQARSSA